MGGWVGITHMAIQRDEIWVDSDGLEDDDRNGGGGGRERATTTEHYRTVNQIIRIEHLLRPG